jgi:hypothetical protein
MVTSPWPSLLGRREQRDEAAVVEGVLTTARARRRLLQGVDEALGVGVDRSERLLDEREEVLAHPPHAGELGAVGHLMEREPQTELTRWECKALLEREHVRADVVDEVLVSGAVLDHQKVVLPEHSGRHPSEQRADLDAGDLRRERRRATLGQPLLEPIGDRTKQSLERGDVRLHPSGAIGDPRSRRTRIRPEPGALRDKVFGLRGELGEVRLQRRVVIRVGEGIVASCEAFRQPPVDQVAHSGATSAVASESEGTRP